MVISHEDFPFPDLLDPPLLVIKQTPEGTGGSRRDPALVHRVGRSMEWSELQHQAPREIFDRGDVLEFPHSSSRKRSQDERWSSIDWEAHTGGTFWKEIRRWLRSYAGETTLEKVLLLRSCMSVPNPRSGVGWKMQSRARRRGPALRLRSSVDLFYFWSTGASRNCNMFTATPSTEVTTDEGGRPLGPGRKRFCWISP